MLSKTSELDGFVHALDQICKTNSKLLKVNTTAGIGQCCDSILLLHHSFVEAKSALDYRISLGANQAIYIQDLEPKANERFFMDEKEIQQITRSIKVGTIDELKEMIYKMVFHMKNSTSSLAQLRNTFLELYVELLRLSRVYELGVDEVTQNVYEEMKSPNSLDEMGEKFLGVCIHLRNGIRKERKDVTAELIEKAKEYIELNYADCELSVEKVCGFLGLSATYFSTLFKKETNLSFVSYLTQVRMEKALELLNTTQEKAYVISQMVGYMEPNYFSYVFKKQYGISPSKYRLNQGI